MEIRLHFDKGGIIIWFPDGSFTAKLTTKRQFLDAVQKARAENKISNKEQYGLWNILFHKGEDVVHTETAFDQILLIFLIYFKGNRIGKIFFAMLDPAAGKQTLPPNGNI